MQLFLSSKKMNVDAKEIYFPESGELIVLQGSILSSILSDSKTFRGRKSIEKSREGVVDGTILDKDVTFKSPSTAANFVTGSSSNGKRLWKSEAGIPIGDLSEEV